MWISSIKHCQLLLIFLLYFFHLISLAFTPSSNSVKLCEFLPSGIVNYYWFFPCISFILFLLLLHLVVIVLNCVNFFHQALSIIIDFSLVYFYFISLASYYCLDCLSVMILSCNLCSERIISIKLWKQWEERKVSQAIESEFLFYVCLKKKAITVKDIENSSICVL